MKSLQTPIARPRAEENRPRALAAPARMRARQRGRSALDMEEREHGQNSPDAASQGDQQGHYPLNLPAAGDPALPLDKRNGGRILPSAVLVKLACSVSQYLRAPKRPPKPYPPVGMPASNTRIAAITATMYGSPMAEHSQKTTAAASIAIRMPITVASLLSVTSAFPCLEGAKRRMCWVQTPKEVCSAG